MNKPTYDLDELSITWQRIASCNKSDITNQHTNTLYKVVMDKLRSNLITYLSENDYNIDELSKPYQRIASVSGNEHEVSKLLLSKISEQL